MLSVSRKSVRFSESEGHLPKEPGVEAARGEENEEGGSSAAATYHPSPTLSPGSREATASSQGQFTQRASESVTLGLEGDAELESAYCLSSSVALSQAASKSETGKEGFCSAFETPLQENQAEEAEVEYKSCCIDTRNYLAQQGLVFKPKNPFSHKDITIYSVDPHREKTSEDNHHKTSQTAKGQPSQSSEKSIPRYAYVLFSSSKGKPRKHKPKSKALYFKLEPGCQSQQQQSLAAKVNCHRSQQRQHIGPVSAKRAHSISRPPPRPSPGTVTEANKMSAYTGMDIYGPVTTATLSRTQERAELQQLNDRFTAYVQRVRMMAEKNNQVDSTAILKTTKVLEVEIHNLRNMYEHELDKLRKELESSNHERTTHQVQVNKQLQCTSELQDRLNVEMDKNGKLMDEINGYQRRLTCVEAEIQDLRIAASRPQAEVEQLQRNAGNLTREIETWKHRYEHEQVARQEAEDRIQQLVKKAEFMDKVSSERMGELHSRIDLSAETIVSLEAKIRDLSKTDVSAAELLKQVRDTAEAELRKFQIESEEQYNRNLTVLKAQLDNDAKAVERLESDRTQLRGSVGELQARIRSLEGQVANLEHQKQTLEDAVSVERNRAADSARALERKLREVQDMLVIKMREVTTAREQNVPLKAEIEALKALLEEEEKRLKLTLLTSTSSTSTTLPPTLSSAAAAALPSSLSSSLPSILPPLTSFGVSTSTQRPPSASRSGLRVPLGLTSGTGNSLHDATSFIQSYNIGTTATANTAAVANTAANTAAVTSVAFAPQLTSTATYTPLSPPATTPHLPPATSTPSVTMFPETRPYEPSPPLSVTYIPEALQSSCGAPCTTYNGLFLPPSQGQGQGYYEDELDPHLYGYASAVPVAKYSYETSPGLNRLAVEPSPPATPRGQPAVQTRAKSAPVERQRNLDLIAADLGQGHDYFDKMFHDLQQDTLYSKGRPKSSPMRNDRPLSSLYHDYTTSTSSATGDLKIIEVHPEGKFIRLHNDGVQEIEFGGFMLQQNVGGHPVAVYRFAPRTKFAPNSTITVYAGCNDHKLHNPPSDFVWKEQQKWGTGPECTTILCRSNGQAVAWTTAAHRFTRDAFQDGQSEGDEIVTQPGDEDKKLEDMDDDSLTEINVNVNGPKPDPVYLRREKQQPPSLNANKHPHGNTLATQVHPHSGPPRPYRYGNDNSSNNRQSRSQTTRPDPIAGQPYAGAAAQKMGSAPLRKYVSGVSTQQQPGVRTSGKSEGGPGEATDIPNPFMKPHARFQSGLDQVQSQHHADFLPPMPRPPLFSTW